ncbi:MAG: carboxylating nicotinate-nucleotide diphosphorylase [Armatimonadota bacterium]
MDLPTVLLEPIVREALREDIGSGDLTTRLTVPTGARATARLVAKQEGVVCGIGVAALAFRLMDPEAICTPVRADGDRVTPGDVLAVVDGPADALLTAERVALNFLQRLSGTATLARRCVDAVAGTSATVVDTRKTTPGLRLLEKYAVRCGGAANHRFGLGDGILIKDNHLAAGGGVGECVRRARAGAPHGIRVEVECKSLEQVEEALAVGADILLLDNMDLPTLRAAVGRIAGRARTEASGGVRLETIRAIAETGVDLVSVGALTHSAPALDISLDFEPVSR